MGDGGDACRNFVGRQEGRNHLEDADDHSLHSHLLNLFKSFKIIQYFIQLTVHIGPDYK